MINRIILFSINAKSKICQVYNSYLGIPYFYEMSLMDKGIIGAAHEVSRLQFLLD